MNVFKRSSKTGRRISPGDPDWSDSGWHTKFMYNGRLYSKALGDCPEREARARAKAWRKAVEQAQWDLIKAPKAYRTSTTLQEYLKWYLEAPLESSTSTRQANVAKLRIILRSAGAAEDISLDAINPTWVTRYLASATGEDQVLQARAKRTANSTAAQALSVFAEHVLEAAADAGMTIPDSIRDLSTTFRRRKYRRLPAVQYNPPSDPVIQATLDAWKACEDRDLFLAIGIELSFALRKSEARAAKWEWFTTQDGNPVLVAATKVKDGTGFLRARALDPFWTTMRDIATSKGWWGVTGAIFDSETPFDQVSSFLRGHGWETIKTNHALRAYSGSLVAMRYGIHDAQTFLRHKSVTQTERSYSHFVKTFRPEDPTQIPCAWAREF